MSVLLLNHKLQFSEITLIESLGNYTALYINLLTVDNWKQLKIVSDEVCLNNS